MARIARRCSRACGHVLRTGVVMCAAHPGAHELLPSRPASCDPCRRRRMREEAEAEAGGRAGPL
eukprot:4962979-Prymnesium_polylepis.1